MVIGDRTDFPTAFLAAQGEVVGKAPVLVEGDHFFVQADTDRMVTLVREHLGPAR